MQIGQTLNILGDEVTLLAAGEDTGGTLTAVEVLAGPGSGPPPHSHVQAEIFYVLDGELDVMVEGRVRTLNAGELAAAPGGAVHTYRNPGTTPTRFLAVMHPTGHERFFAELGNLAPAGPPDVAQVTAVARRHGVDFVVPA